MDFLNKHFRVVYAIIALINGAAAYAQYSGLGPDSSALAPFAMLANGLISALFGYYALVNKKIP